MVDACETPMEDHIKRFYELLKVPGAIVRVDTPNPLGYDTAHFGEGFAPALIRSLSLRVEAEKRAREEAETNSAALARALEDVNAKVDAFWNDPERPSVHRMRSKSVHELSDAQRRAQSLLAPKEDTDANGGR